MIEIDNEKEFDDPKGDDLISDDITNPFDVKDIKVTHKLMVMRSLIDRLEHNEIDLNPDFQRNGLLWTQKQMSALIESIILRLPLPIFYFDVSNDNRWLVVDGLQRLSALKKFIVEKKENFRLKDLEFLDDLEGKQYEDLPREYQRVIKETEIITYQIEGQTPDEVKYSIFNRINTGGLTLNSQEIRQALNQKGDAVGFLKDITNEDIFKDMIYIQSKRMLDRELVLRFISFKLTHYTKINQYRSMDDFLNEAMKKLDSMDQNELKKIKENFLVTLQFCQNIFQSRDPFSRSENPKRFNRSLFDSIVVSLSDYIERKDTILEHKEKFVQGIDLLLNNQQGEFYQSITRGTSNKNSILKRFQAVENIIQSILNEN